LPLLISGQGGYLVDQRGTPFRLQGDTAWSLITSTTLDEATRYLEHRRRQGFNAVLVDLLQRMFFPDGTRNRNGDEPFTTRGDFSTPNEAYFAHAERVIELAADRGILVVLTGPSWLGYPQPQHPGYEGQPEGWYSEILSSGPAKCRDWGRYLGRRFERYDNLVWVMGGDRNPGVAQDCVRAVAEGIREYDSRHLMTAHVHPECSPVDVYAGESWLDLNVTYTYGIVHSALLADYNRKPSWPFVLIESTYEGEHNASHVQVRRQAYWAMLSGACGQFMGNKPVWMFGPGWESALDSPGSVAMTHLGSLFASVPWWELVPDQAHEVVVDGLGEFRGLDYCAAARTADRGLILAYMPTARTVTIDMSEVASGSADASWFDPITGGIHEVGAIPTRGFQDFVPPADQDWVLVVRSRR
jgi:hypothetical protein